MLEEKIKKVAGELNLFFSEEAAAMAHRLRDETADWQNLPLRIYIEGKGCDGFFYGVSFDEKQPEDLVASLDGLEVIIDEESYQFLKDSKIVWADDERGRGFLVENPNHKKFRGKFFRRKTWKERLL